jgi:ferric-dicitrate binding protein FerR (iron transport regulator)
MANGVYISRNKMMEAKYTILIEKYLRGNLSPAEVEELKLWLAENEENRNLFDTMQQNWQPEEDDDSNVDTALEELHFKLQMKHSDYKGSNLNVVRRKTLFVNLLKVAAILFVGFLLNQVIHSYLKNDSEKTQWYTVSAAEGQKSKIVLADGTEVWLNSESTLRIPVSESPTSRKVELTGEAYFKVTKNPKIPFIVKTKAYNVEVYGTEFNVMAYDDFNRTETTLVNGIVKICRQNNELLMKPGQTMVFANNQFKMKSGKVEQAVSWKDEKFYFDAIPFSELVMRLERWYNVEIVISDTNLKSRLYSGVFKNEETIWQVLDVVEKTSPIHYERSGFRKIVISSK